MSSPFEQPIDFEKAQAYLATHTPEQAAIDSRSWPCDPTDILTFADTTSMFLKADEHAIALYNEALRRLKEHPEEASPDTDLVAAYVSLGILLANKERTEEAVEAFTNAIRVGGKHPFIKLSLAIHLFGLSRFEEAMGLINQILQIPSEQLSQELSDEQIETVHLLRAALNAQDEGSEVEEEIDRAWGQASAAIAAGNYQQAADFFRQVIGLLLKLEASLPADASPEALHVNIANAYCDLGRCILQYCGMHVNQAVHALIQAIRYGSREDSIIENLLFCMSRVNAFMEAQSESAPDIENRQELLRWHNSGYDLLKTPYPQGTPNRNWDGAIRCFEEAVRIAPNSAASWHGLGLAYEGAKRDHDAVRAWLKVAAIDPEYNFQMRRKLN